MAQGFKGKAPAPQRTRSAASERKGAGQMKKGARVIPPKRKDLIDQAARKKSSSGAHGQRLEEEYARQAKAKGKLSEMMTKVAARDAPGTQTSKASSSKKEASAPAK